MTVMSSTILPAPAEPASSPATASTSPDLAALRARLDRLDDALHDLLMERAEVVEEVANSGAKGRNPLRPGREAIIIRRLLARHRGALPPQTLVRIWREMLAGTTAMQGQFLVAVCDTEENSAMVALAREHFGALTPLRIHGTPAGAIREVSTGAANVALLPLPSEDMTGSERSPASWWNSLLHRDEPRIHVVARLPFWTRRPEGGVRVQALVVSTTPPDASGEDCSLIGLEINTETSRARVSAALTAAGVAPRSIILHRHAGEPVAHALVEVEGMVQEDDPRLAASLPVLRPPVVLGAYAVPIEGATP
jgi:chorismate mutase / prephenate dehydratase